MTTTPTANPELLDLDKLEALARAATAGPWLHRRDPGNPIGAQHCVKLASENGAWVCDCIDNADRSTVGGIAGERNAAVIASAHPDAVLALIAFARRAQPYATGGTVPGGLHLAGEAPQATCTVPPEGWHCTRAPGHDGPCAAWPIAQQAAAPGALDDLDFTPDAHHQVADMANVGYELMQTIKALRPDYCWNDTPAEIVSDLINELDEATASAPGTPEAPQTAAARDVLAERQRQVEQEGWTPAHDDAYVDGQLASAAVAYAQAYTPYLVPSSWPWAVEWFKAGDDRRNMVKAGALILAEIERLDRAAQLAGGQGEGQ